MRRLPARAAYRCQPPPPTRAARAKCPKRTRSAATRARNSSREGSGRSGARRRPRQRRRRTAAYRVCSCSARARSCARRLPPPSCSTRNSACSAISGAARAILGTAPRRDGFDAERWNRLHPEGKQRVPYVTECLADRAGPRDRRMTDFVREFADQIRAFIPDGKKYTVLGCDGSAAAIRARTCAVSSKSTATTSRRPPSAAALAAEGKMSAKDVARAIKILEDRSRRSFRSADGIS